MDNTRSSSIMSILGIGTDIIEIERIEKAISHSGNRLASRVLSEYEWNQYQIHHNPVRFLAKYFAAKEAASKAFGTGMRNGLAFNQFEIYNDKLGKPSLRFIDQADRLAKKLGVLRVHVTLSDERHYAFATVIIEG